jgi:hypothetical protein
VVQIAVIQKGQAWSVLRDGSPVGEGLRRSEAVALGERLSFEAEENEAVELVIQDYTGEVRTTYSGGD